MEELNEYKSKRFPKQSANVSNGEDQQEATCLDSFWV